MDELLGQAVRRRKKADVPVGVFLSGGVDSSAVLAHLAAQNGPGVPVFALGHKDPAFDESGFARATAERFRAAFHALVLDESDLAGGLARVAAGFDEPLGDASTIPTHLLSVFARERVKVVLSGEGGDELFGGYPWRYYRAVVNDDFAPSLHRQVLSLLAAADPQQDASRCLQFVIVTTMNWQTFSKRAFRFELTAAIAAKSLLFAFGMGLAGGALPALRAARLGFVDALRAS